MTLKRCSFLVMGSLAVAMHLQAQDTMTITLQQAEQQFVQKNLSLLAAKYNIDANKALVQQAKLWDNPVLNTDQNIYDGKFFRHTATSGQVYVQVMQLIRTAGKLNKAAQLAGDNVKLSEQQFNDLLRTLRYTLRSDLEETNHLLKIKIVYDAEILQVQKLSQGMDEELKAGNIALKDNMRIKALLFDLQNELVNVQAQLIPLQSEIRSLLQTNENVFVKPSLEYKFGELTKITAPVADSLVQLALQNRPDVQVASAALALQEHNLVYQKALAKPDISAGVEYDRLSSYTPNYVGLAVSLPLNIFNRNQGNIRAAKFNIQSQQTTTQLVNNKVQNDVFTAYNKFLFYQQVNNSAQLEFSNSYDNIFTNMLKSYQDRQVGLLEFIDFMDSYKDTKLKLVDQHNSLVKSVEDMNYAVGSDVIKLN